MQLWDAFLEDYTDEVFNWSPRQLLEIFWYYCQDGSKAVYEFLNKDAVLTPVEADKLKQCRFVRGCEKRYKGCFDRCTLYKPLTT